MASVQRKSARQNVTTVEGLLQQKAMNRLSAAGRQQDKLIKEGKDNTSPRHLGKGDPRPCAEQLCWLEADFHVRSSLLESLCTDNLIVKVSKNEELVHPKKKWHYFRNKPQAANFTDPRKQWL